MWVLEAVVTEAVHNTASLFAFRNEVMDSNPQSTRACNSNIPPEHLGTLHTMRLMEIRLLGSFGHCFATLDRFTVPLLEARMENSPAPEPLQQTNGTVSGSRAFLVPSAKATTVPNLSRSSVWAAKYYLDLLPAKAKSCKCKSTKMIRSRLETC